MIGRNARKRLPWLAAPLLWVLLAGGLGAPTLVQTIPQIGNPFLGVGRGIPPKTLVIDRIGLRAEIVSIEIDAKGVLTPPSDTRLVGWWKDSAGAGATKGQILLTGHTVHTGGGVMNRMGEVLDNDPVVVISEGKEFQYHVTDNIVLSKAEVAEQAVELFGQDRHNGRLVLVTCTDFDGREYQSNIIVFAEPGPPL